MFPCDHIAKYGTGQEGHPDSYRTEDQSASAYLVRFVAVFELQRTFVSLMPGLRKGMENLE